MNQPNQSNREFSLLLDALLDDTLDESQRLRLTTILRDDPEARAHYVALMEIHAELHWRHDQTVLVQPEPEVARPAHNEARHTLLGIVNHLPATIQPTQHPVRFLVAASLLTAMFCGTLLLMLGSQGGRGSGNKISAQSEYVATITHLQDVVWSESQAPAQLGARLSRGDRLELKRGLVHLIFLDGARVVIEGPASLRIDAPGAMSLDSGRLLARVSKRAVGFTVETPNVEVVDLGTEFGIEVQEEETEVQVFEGTVQARLQDEDRNQVHMLSAGQAVAFGNSPQQGFYVKEKKMNRAIYLTLATVISLSAPHVGTGATVTLREGLGGYASTHDATLVSNQGGTAHDFLTDGGRSVQESWGATVTPYSTTRGGTSWSTGMLRFGDIFTFGSIPAGSTIDSATLAVTVTNPIEGTQLAVMTTGWDESTVTWNAFGSGSPNPSGGVTPGVDASSTLTSLGTLSGTTSIDVTADVQSWLDNPSTNFGWAFLRNDENKGLFVASEDVVNTAERPTLTINFTAPPVPEPGSAALLGLGGMMVLGFARKRRRQRRNAA